ncbi:phospholipase B1, membrane-associated-like isoform X1 [Anguilla rostrata]|uniref:phospholipase B1, membrane-associated-like isoform X1 n=1 Tax=Anguilla rostrata TaxID=7938 RepID=UPI0030CD7C57
MVTPRHFILTLFLMALLGLHPAFPVSGTLQSDSSLLKAPTNGLPSWETHQTNNWRALPCAQPMPYSLPPSSVHSLRPSDIASVSAIGLPQSQRSAVSRVMKQLSELMSMVNPNLISMLPDQTNTQQRSLLEQVNELVLSFASQKVKHSEGGWGLVLLFVPVDDLCVCSEQTNAVVGAAMQQLEVTLQTLHSQLRRTVVSVVVWGGQSEAKLSLADSRECRCQDTHSPGELRIMRAIVSQVLQESLGRHLVEKQWYSDRDDFTVVLQASPLDTDNPSILEMRTAFPGLSPKHISKLALQLWENLLQPISGQSDLEHDDAITSVPCPNEDRPFLRTERNSPSVFLTEDRPTHSYLYDPIMGGELNCEDRSPSPSPPTSVHALRPADIKVVAALGDSLTAANGVGAAPNNLLDVLRQYRGLSWSIGGDENLTTITTLPNVLRSFNPSLTGFSEGIGKEGTPKAFLNLAVAGAISDDMPGQARLLVDMMKTDPRINFDSDWKVITLFIGGNDLCSHCKNTVFYSAENFVYRIRQALDILHNEVPRALVNLVEPLHIVPLRRLHQERSLMCPTWLVNVLCNCVIPPKEGSKQLQTLNDLNRAYQRGLWELVESGRYDTHSNFTVVLQPFFRNVVIPLLEDGRPDRSYFTPDCFHLSQKSHSLMARALWNNMLEPLGNKSYTQDFNSVPQSLKCPSKTSPFLRTYENSNYTYQGPVPTPPPITNWGSDFSCKNNAPSNPAPTSVHSLRPADVKVVAALGDSTTAGVGAKAKNILQLSKEYRGVSWSIGGEGALENVTTLPNILKKFNPSLHGSSAGQGSWQKGYNMATPGAKASEIPTQIENLIKAMKKDMKVDFKMDWKVVTLFVGVTDLCDFCVDQDNLSPKNYSHHLMQSLDLLYKEVPRVLVNVLEVLQIEGVRRVKEDTLGCSVLQGYMCPCILLPEENSPELTEMKRVNREYQAKTEYLVSTGRYDKREDFTVVIQPFFQNPIIPLTEDGRPDQSYFSADCFHFSERAHSEMAIALWNNMLQPVGQKQAYNNFTLDRNKIQCPTEDKPFIFTRINSLHSVPTAAPTSLAPPPSTTAAPVATTTAHTPLCSESMPTWVAPVLGVAGLLIGWGVTWLLFSCRERRHRKKAEENIAEMKGTEF